MSEPIENELNELIAEEGGNSGYDSSGETPTPSSPLNDEPEIIDKTKKKKKAPKREMTPERKAQLIEQLKKGREKALANRRRAREIKKIKEEAKRKEEDRILRSSLLHDKEALKEMGVQPETGTESHESKNDDKEIIKNLKKELSEMKDALKEMKAKPKEKKDISEIDLLKEEISGLKSLIKETKSKKQEPREQPENIKVEKPREVVINHVEERDKVKHIYRTYRGNIWDKYKK
jgi:hypothetical protein